LHYSYVLNFHLCSNNPFRPPFPTRRSSDLQLDAGHCAAGRRERRPGPLHFDLATEPAHPQAAMPDPRIEPFAQPQAFQLGDRTRSEEHTSELQSLAYLVCRLLLEKKNKPPS